MKTSLSFPADDGRAAGRYVSRVALFCGMSLLLFLGAAYPSGSQLKAQRPQLGNTEFDLSFHLGLPQGPFRDQLDKAGFGMKGTVGLHVPQSPLYAGIDFSFLTFGTDRRKEVFSSNIPDVRVQVDNSYNMASGLGLLRFTGQDFVFRPYIEGLLGFNYLFTQSTVRSGGEEVASDINLDDFAPAYGIGAGVQYLIWDGRTTHASLMYLNVQLRYIRGGSAEYVRPGTIDTSGPAAEFETAESRTDTAYIQVGVSVRM